jgi:site-specific DNA-cytosine methylase
MIPRQRFQKVGRPISFAVDPVPDFLDKVINERLHGAEVQALAGWVAASKSCSIGSVCAGTDCPVDVSRQVLEAVCRSTGVPMPKFEHRFSFENNRLKRKFLHELHPDMEMMYGDAMDLPSGCSYDYKQQKRVKIPAVQKLKAGFPCTDVSSLNPASQNHREVVSSGSLRTGGVFQAILRYAAACKDTLQSVTLENVTALLAPPRRKKGMGHSNATACIRGLEKIGLCTHLFQLDPSTMFGVPVSRPRVFFLAVPKKKIKGVMSNSEYHLMLTDIMQRLVGHPMVDLDEFLLQENSVPIQEYYAMLQADLELQRGNVDQAMIAQGGYHDTYPRGLAGATGSAGRSGRHCDGPVPAKTKWVGEHSSLLENVVDGVSMTLVNTNTISDELTAMYPGLLDLTARELDVLQMSKVAFPERRKVTVELSQALMRTRVKHGQTATVTPKMRRYLAHRCRFAHGVEAMNLQCIRFGGGKRLAKAHSFPPALLQDLAGNAFNALCDAASEMALNIVLAVVHRRRLQALVPPRLLPLSAPDIGLDDTWTDVWVPEDDTQGAPEVD